MTPTPPAAPLRELTWRAVVLGGAITLVFTAANVYMGLKIGLTFATSIPAAVISMAVLRGFADSSILENNIVQTVASAAGTLAAIIFVLPGLVMIGAWSSFPFVETAALTAAGGILGVMFSVPLRRALVVEMPLPYPEGNAAAEVLKVGAGERDGDGDESGRGVRLIGTSALASAGFMLLTQTKLVAGEAAAWFRIGRGATGIAGGLSFALIGIGHLVGLSVGLAMLLGVALGAWVVLPILTAHAPSTGADVAAWAGEIFKSKVRFFGAGVIGIAAIWTLLRILGPVVRGVTSAFVASRKSRTGEALRLQDRDLPFGVVAAVSLLLLVPIGIVLHGTLAGGPLAGAAPLLVGGALVFVLVIGLVVASVCGYMAGLIGASNSPLSGIGILAILAASLLLAGLYAAPRPAETTQALVAYALVVTAVVFGVATISNDNLQDLKTGQLVGATPWRQQVALVVGVVFGAIVVPPVLNLLGSTLGFQGAPHAGPQALAAPQAALISSLAKGVLGGDLDWSMIGAGALVGAVLVAVDEALGRAGRLRLPPLGVGLGVYLPMTVTLPVVLGAVLGHAYERSAADAADPDRARRMGVLMATGLIVGESLWGVAYAGAVYLSDREAPLALPMRPGESGALVAGLLTFAVLLGLLYWRTARPARAAA